MTAADPRNELLVPQDGCYKPWCGVERLCVDCAQAATGEPGEPCVDCAVEAVQEVRSAEAKCWLTGSPLAATVGVTPVESGPVQGAGGGLRCACGGPLAGSGDMRLWCARCGELSPLAHPSRR